MASTRPLRWKNTQRLKEAFVSAQKQLGNEGRGLKLDLGLAPYEEFIKKEWPIATLLFWFFFG